MLWYIFFKIKINIFLIVYILVHYMYQDVNHLGRRFQEFEEDINQVINEDHMKSGFESLIDSIQLSNVSYRIELKYIPKKPSRLSMRTKEEVYYMQIDVLLDDHSQITEIKNIIYEFLNKYLPDMEHHVTQDYTSKTIESKLYLTKEKVKYFI